MLSFIAPAVTVFASLAGIAILLDQMLKKEYVRIVSIFLFEDSGKSKRANIWGSPYKMIAAIFGKKYISLRFFSIAAVLSLSVIVVHFLWGLQYIQKYELLYIKESYSYYFGDNFLYLCLFIVLNLVADYLSCCQTAHLTKIIKAENNFMSSFMLAYSDILLTIGIWVLVMSCAIFLGIVSFSHQFNVEDVKVKVSLFENNSLVGSYSGSDKMINYEIRPSKEFQGFLDKLSKSEFTSSVDYPRYNVSHATSTFIEDISSLEEMIDVENLDVRIRETDCSAFEEYEFSLNEIEKRCYSMSLSNPFMDWSANDIAIVSLQNSINALGITAPSLGFGWQNISFSRVLSNHLKTASDEPSSGLPLLIANIVENESASHVKYSAVIGPLYGSTFGLTILFYVFLLIRFSAVISWRVARFFPKKISTYFVEDKPVTTTVLGFFPIYSAICAIIYFVG